MIPAIHGVQSILGATIKNPLVTEGTTSGASSFEHINALTSLRFFAAFMIVLYHFNSTFPLNTFGFISGCALEQGVSFFFVLSGFLLFYCYPNLTSLSDARAFLIARFARIWPAHLSTVILYFAVLNQHLFVAKGSVPLWICIVNVLLLQAWIPQSRVFFSLNAPAWSVSDEMFFYLLFPILAFSWAKTWRWKLLLSLCSALVLVAICAFLTIHGTRTPILDVYKGLLYISPLARLFEFVLGMATALAFRKASANEISTTRATIIEAVFLVSILANLWLAPLLIRIAANTPIPIFYWLEHISGAPLFAGLICVTALKTGLLARILNNPATMFLGEISYSLYMVHWIVLQYFADHLRSTAAISAELMFLGFLITVLGVSTANYFLVEIPLRKTIRSLLA